MVEALDSVRPYMESHGGNVELLGLEDGVARIRLQGSCDGCPASSATLELAIKQALEEAAPISRGSRSRARVEPHPARRRRRSAAIGAADDPGRAAARPTAQPAWLDLDGELDGLAEGERRPPSRSAARR